jgi:hypothetical protein
MVRSASDSAVPGQMLDTGPPSRDTVVAGNGGVLGGARSAQHLHTSAVVRIANLADRGDYIGAGRA